MRAGLLRPAAIVLVLPTASCFLIENPTALDVRVVDWNPSGSDWNLDNDIDVAETVIDLVDYMDAHIVTLQEVTDTSLDHFEDSLPGWVCERELFGVDYIAVCTDGPFTSVDEIEPTLSNETSGCGCQYAPDESACLEATGHWGYVQVEYNGMLITSVHIRSCWDVEQIEELYTEVTTGIVAGDFNHVSPDVDGWTQTDDDLEWTHGPYVDDPDGVDDQHKYDHVFAIEATDDVYGDAWNDKEGSNHKPVLAGITFRDIIGGADP